MSINATEANALAARATYSETLWENLEIFAQKITNNPVDEYGRKLKAEFDDPRVVDRKLELEEQNTYATTHTVDEMNEKYYQEDRRNDEFGKTPVVLLKSRARKRPTRQRRDTRRRGHRRRYRRG